MVVETGENRRRTVRRFRKRWKYLGDIGGVVLE